MDNRHLIDDQELEKIKEQGCCLGKYRIPIEGVFYCYLESIFNCAHQDKRFVKKLNSNILVCKTNKQLPCEECEVYAKSKLAING